ncbi:odorant receptor 82a-like isoform X1 [Diachasma alloeum]|uniref:odorant receptor 82a-like isoform X1 n=1 Tax=Diachasma alloeum TaxID=454923 RepID=UPI0010FB7E1D|nr:odorant receptor 82a-like isoform X1 [Diachasma alloeum]
MMDFWDQDYFRVVKITTCLVGQWPYQSSKEVIFSRSIIIILVIIHLIPRIRALILYGDDPEIILSVSSPLIIDIVFVFKTVNNSYNFKRMKNLLRKIYENWRIFSTDELQILHQYSASGKKSATIYLGVVIGSAGLFITQPLQLQLVHILMKTNETIRLFPVPVDYGSINVDKYYWSITLLTEFTTVLIALGIVACDLLFFTYSYHVFGLFATLGYTIEHLPIDNDNGFSDEMHVKRCIKLHYRIIEFANELEDLYRWTFLAVIGFNMILISIIAVELVVNLGSAGKMIQYGSLTVSPFGHLFVECLMGQRLIDHSLGIQEYISNAQWCDSSVKSQKMINLFLMRSQLPCQLTAGKLLVMNFETFNTIVRTSASYFTVLLATQ